jgi:cell wall-associated NlpC family hydrolase
MTTLQPKTRAALLQVATWQEGVCEYPHGTNRVKYGKEYGLNGQAWCLMFVWWCFREAGFNLYKTASCTALANRYKAAGQWVTGGYRPGDIVMFDFSGQRKRTQHCGIVIEATDTHVVTMEGNTSDSNDANGGMVMRRIRSQKFVTGACRPNYPD